MALVAIGRLANDGGTMAARGDACLAARAHACACRGTAARSLAKAPPAHLHPHQHWRSLYWLRDCNMAGYAQTVRRRRQPYRCQRHCCRAIERRRKNINRLCGLIPAKRRPLSALPSSSARAAPAASGVTLLARLALSALAAGSGAQQQGSVCHVVVDDGRRQPVHLAAGLGIASRYCPQGTVWASAIIRRDSSSNGGLSI